MLDIGRLEERVQSGMLEARVPALSLAVIHEGELIHSAGFGVTSVEDGGVPVTPSTLFRIASTSKPFAAAVILQLVGDGRIDLDKTVRSYLPWFTLSDARAAETVTVRHLMTGLSGLPADNQTEAGSCPDALERFVRDQVPTYQAVGEPGSVFVYSNPAINVAGYLAEAVAGISFPDLVAERVFKPLGMERSTFDPCVAMTYPHAQPHHVDDDGVQRVSHLFTDNRASYPSGGIFSTALDVARFARMLLDQGTYEGERVLGAAEFAEMTTPHARTFWPPPYFSPTTTYGLMLFLHQYKGRLRWGHPGGVTSFNHTFELLPETRSAVIVQTNGTDGALGHGLADAIFDELLGLPEDSQPATNPEDTSAWAAYVGTYVNDRALYEGAKPIGKLVIGVRGDNLVAIWNGAETVLTALGPDFYRAESDEQGPRFIGFHRDGEGPARWVTLNLQPARRAG